MTDGMMGVWDSVGEGGASVECSDWGIWASEAWVLVMEVCDGVIRGSSSEQGPERRRWRIDSRDWKSFLKVFMMKVHFQDEWAMAEEGQANETVEV